ncbi:hypothetical protein [Phytopseudomonas dryadis]|uniref:Uncharacterized protein n=1 Tax=Phytopseudomonas dryadis TaxID=2487520 RepID=A0A4Q9RBM5_9GAMM|nr:MULTISPECIES: hypothetical protein [Pseudomonas]TBU97628.1 hypothetical protein DNK44_01200 [Pseudomonas dryadis]TBV10083.1 hypothetical protein DNK34_01210 [Pseudomonas dryadis]TBV19086.1 hypothetical protein DNK41_05035 [Pseudomonas sp. FRB 230]
MQQMLMTIVLLITLTGCVQPQVEQPRVNASYLVIEDDQAWAVLVSDGKRVEEQGVVVDAIKLASSHAAVAASYVIDTPNCGKVQWLVERQDVADGTTSRMVVQGDERLSAAGCVIGEGLSRVWTVLDYSS